MKYKSTRGGVVGVTFQEALLSGYAPDGGLFVPESLPRFTREEIRRWSKLSYQELIKQFFPYFVSPEELNSHEIAGKFLIVMSDPSLAFQYVRYSAPTADQNTTLPSLSVYYYYCYARGDGWLLLSI